MKAIIIIGVILLALPFLVFGALAVIAGLGLTGLRRDAAAVLSATQPETHGPDSPGSGIGDQPGAQAGGRTPG